jgi:hypothetical protein
MPSNLTLHATAIWEYGPKYVFYELHTSLSAPFIEAPISGAREQVGILKGPHYVLVAPLKTLGLRHKY